MTDPFEAHDNSGRKRNSCKAVMVKDGRILLTKNHYDMEDFYLLPGGGQKFGETLHQAMQREVLEETGWVVDPGDIILVRDYIGANHEFSDQESDVHQTELIFRATPLYRRSDGMEPDPWQTGIEWVNVKDVKTRKIYPSIFNVILPLIMLGKYRGSIYLGDVN